MYLIQHSHPMFILEELFCDLDDFCALFEPQWQSQLLSQGLIAYCYQPKKPSLNLETDLAQYA